MLVETPNIGITNSLLGSTKNSDFLYVFNCLHVAKLFYLLGFEPREYASRLSFEKWCRMH